MGGLTSKLVQDSPLSLGFPTLYAARWRVSILRRFPRWSIPPPVSRWWCITGRGRISLSLKKGFASRFAHDGQVVAFYQEQIKSATGNNSQFDPANPDIRFSRSAAPSLSEVAETGRDTAWTGPAASKWDDFIYKMQDKHIDTKRALEAVRATQQKILI